MAERTRAPKRQILSIGPAPCPVGESSDQRAPGSSTAGAPRRAGHYFGWNVVAAAFVIAIFGWGLGFYGPPVYLEVIHQSRGWPIALVSGAVTLHYLVGLVAIPNLPALYRRFGLAVVTFAGAVLLAFGVSGWALAITPWQLYLAALLSGSGWSALGAVAINTIVSPWFVTRRPQALGIAFNGGSVGGVIFSPLWIALIDHIGFTSATLVMSGVMLTALGALAILVLRRNPEIADQTADVASADNLSLGARQGVEATSPRTQLHLFHSRAFLTLCIGMTLALFAQTGVVAHLVSVLAPALGRQGAGLTAGAVGLTAVVGRVLVGSRANDKSNWRGIACLSLMAQVLGCAVLVFVQGGHPTLLIFGAVLFGLGVGNAISVPPVIANLEFSGADAARAVALIVAISQGAYAIAPVLFGLLRQTLSDQAMFAAAILIQLAAIAAYLLGPRARLLERLRPGLN